MSKKVQFLFVFLLVAIFSFSQKKDSLHISLYADAYYLWFPETSKAERPIYTANYHQFNRTNLNFSAANLYYQNNHFRTGLGVMTGTYVKRNMGLEDKWARNIYEASIGYRFTSDEDIWLDAGILPSHIGFESVPAHQNWSATRSIVADLSPYYETGLRLSYRPNTKWYFAILSLNGWQRITVPVNRLGESWGMQINFQPKKNWIINSSSFIGKVPSAGEHTTRIYSNLYSSLQLNNRTWLMAGWDWGIQDNNRNQWNDLLIQARYAIIEDKFFGNMRYEYFADPQSLFLPDFTGGQHKVHLHSLNVDYLPVKLLMLRAEINYQYASGNIFQKMGVPVNQQFSLLFVASVKLDYAR